MLRGYQTLEFRDNNDEIELNGPFPCHAPNAWLGEGYYFWDRRIEWAHEWGKNCMKRKKTAWKGYVIGEALLNNDETVMFDLYGNPEHQEEFRSIKELLEGAPAYHMSRPTVKEVLDFMIRKNILEYKAVRAADNNPNTTEDIYFDHKEKNAPYMRIGQRVQICLYEKSSITLQNFSVIHTHQSP